MRVREDYRTLTGPEKAAILMLSIGEEYASRLFALMDDEEIKELSQSMSDLGTVSAPVIERLFAEFTDHLSSSGATDSPARLLAPVPGKTPVDLGNVNEEALVGSLKKESPQTVAGVLSRITPEQTARILGQLPEAFAQDVIMRMLRLKSAQAMEDVEPEARTDAMNTLARIGEDSLPSRSRASALRLQATQFAFEDLGRLGPAGVQTLLRTIDRSKLALALKGASEPLRDLFFANMSARAGRQLREEIQALGPVKLRDVDEAQMYMVTAATELAAKDERVIAGSHGDDELIY
jgi:flagellar motor switch protein FliG